MSSKKRQDKPNAPMTWKDVEVNSSNSTYKPKTGSGVLLSSDLARKQGFYRVVGRNLFVLDKQNIYSDTTRASRIQRDYSHIGAERLALIKSTTLVCDLMDILYGADKWRKASPAEAEDYKTFLKEREAFVVAARERSRKFSLDRLQKDLKQSETNVNYYKAQIAKIMKITEVKPSQTKTVNK